MNQQFPISDRFPGGGNIHIGNISIDAPVSGGLVQIGHGNMAVFQLKVLGVQDATLHLEPQDPLLHMLMQMVTNGNAQRNQLSASGITPDVVLPVQRDEDAPFASPFGVPTRLSGDASQHVQGLGSFNELLQQLDQRFGGPLASLSNEQQSVNLSDVLLQKGNLALWRFRQGALCLFAEQASLYLLAEPQDPAQPLLVAFQTAARTNLEVLRGWVLFQKYRISVPGLTDPQTFAALSQGRWQVVLDSWSAGRHLSSEQAQAERSYLNALGDPYDAQAVQSAVREAEWYFKEALRRQPNQSAALVNLAALLAESALLNYIETGNLDRVRLQQAQIFFQQAHVFLDQRSDHDGKVALAQCLLYEATSLPPDARLDMIQWAASRTQQLRAALGPDAPRSIRWDIAQRNLARRDPSLLDQPKIEQAHDLLISVGAMAGLVSLAEYWLDAHAQMANLLGAGIKTGVAQHLPLKHLVDGSPGSTTSPHQPLPGTHSVSQSGDGLVGHKASTADKAVGRHIGSRLLSTAIGKVLVTVVAVVVVLGGSFVGMKVADKGQFASQSKNIKVFLASPTTLPTTAPATLWATPTTAPATPNAALENIKEFVVPTADGDPGGITTGPDGNLWFTEGQAGKIGRITPSGRITEFVLPTANSGPGGITVGPDGSLWFTEGTNLLSQIGRITPSGTITEFALPTANSDPVGITAGPDGNLWFTEYNGTRIGRITPAGTITEFSVPTAQAADGITAGPDDNLWFTESVSNQIGCITPEGSVTEFAVPTANSAPLGITVGPDGNLWFTENNGGQIGRITPTGMITEFTVPIGGSPYGITKGPDGNLWFTEYNGNQIGRITPSGIVTEFALPISFSTPEGITAGPDGNLWFTEYLGNKVGWISPGS